MRILLKVHIMQQWGTPYTHQKFSNTSACWITRSKHLLELSQHRKSACICFKFGTMNNQYMPNSKPMKIGKIYSPNLLCNPFCNADIKIHIQGPTRNRCHVTAIDIIGKRTPELDPVVFCCKIWSKIISYLNKHEIWPKYSILSQWWIHTKLKKTSKGVFAVLSSSWRYPVCDFFGLNHWMKAGVKPNDMVIPILSVHCLNHIFRQLPWP